MDMETKLSGDDSHQGRDATVPQMVKVYEHVTTLARDVVEASGETTTRDQCEEPAAVLAQEYIRSVLPLLTSVCS